MSRADERACGAKLLVLTGTSAGSVVPIGDKLTLGRRPENDLSLRDDQISRFHAVIVRRGDEFILEDLGSRTGTKIDGRAIRVPTALSDGDRIVVGHTVMRFSANALEEGAAAYGVFTDPAITLDRTAMQKPESLTFIAVDSNPAMEDLDRKDEQALRRAGNHLQTLLGANAIMSSELDIERIFERILDAVFDAFPAHRAVIMTTKPDSAELTVRAARVVGPATPASSPRISQTITDRVLRDRMGVLAVDATADERFHGGISVLVQNIRSAICAPMIHHDDLLGVIYLDTVGVTHAFREDELRLLTGISAAAAGSVHNAMLASKLRDTAVDTIFRLAIAAEYRDGDTGAHIHRMSDYAETIATRMGLGREICERIKLASPMHDVGKIGIPDAILKKRGTLTKQEFEVMKEHPEKGAAILANSSSDLLHMAHDIALTHHEKFDGTGYPRGLAGNAIPIAGRIVAAADVFDALTSRRCYKEGFALDKSFGILRKGAGQHFDPDVVEAFMTVKDRIIDIREFYRRLEAEADERGEELTTTRLLFERRPHFSIDG